jgi:hypothetical protein
MYEHQSNQTADISHNTVVNDLIKKGWVVCFPSSRDTCYDLVVEKTTKNGGRVFKTLQIKTLSAAKSFKTNSRGSAAGNEKVSINGGVRKDYNYADVKIDWMVGVDPVTHEIYYYPLRIYKNHTTINVKKVKDVPFDVHLPKGRRKKK